jgi:hypothetical protein
MKKISAVLLFAFPCILCNAQGFRINLFGGIANYQGDLQGKRLNINQSKPAVGLGAQYELSNKFSIRTGLTFAKIAGDDVKNTTAKGIEFRNLSFKSNLTEFHLGIEYNLLRLEGKSITPYVFAGAGVFHYNPYTNDVQGNKVFLRPLSTEGQGLAAYPDRKPYNLTQLSIPFGGGIKYQTNNNLQISLEVGLRKTFTDYLDDVSTNYVDQNILLAERGAKAVELAYRGDEVSAAVPYPADGAQRGSPKYKDWYYFTGIRVSKLIRNREDRISYKSSRLACPGNRF